MPILQSSALLQEARKLAAHFSPDELRTFFSEPLIILSAPRSGSTLLFETLKCSDHFWSIGGESHIIFNAFPQLHASSKKFRSGALSERDATPELCHLIRAFFLLMVIDNNGRRYLDVSEHERPGSITLLEKTPRNALNIPFLKKIFPDMKVIFLYRSPRENISSMIEAWETGLRTGRFVTFTNIPGWERKHWCLILPPGWRKMKGKSIPEISAFQWVAANETILKDLRKYKSSLWMLCDYHDLVNNTKTTIQRIAKFAGVDFNGSLQAHASNPLPLSNTIVTTPKPDKWKRHSDILKRLENTYRPTERKFLTLLGRQGS